MTDTKGEVDMNWSYQEKIIAASVAASLLVYGEYFAESVSLWREGVPDTDAVSRLVTTMVLLVIVEVVYHVVIAMMDRPVPKDERDRLIDANAHRNAYVALVASVVLILSHILFAESLPELAWYSPALTPFLLAQTMLAALVAADVVKGATKLYFYRKGL